MRVSNQTANNIASQEASNTAKSDRNRDPSSARSSGASAQSDAVRPAISGAARELAKAKDIASSVSDVREDRVAELKRRIAEKEYSIKPDAIADRMFQEHLRTSDLG